MAPITLDDLNIGCLERILALEDELTRQDTFYTLESGQEKALLINVFTDHLKEAVASLDELKELCRSSSIQVLDTVLRKEKKLIPNL